MNTSRYRNSNSNAIRAKFGRSISANSNNKWCDLDGDGRLDAIEQVMISYGQDDGDHIFTNEVVHGIIQERVKAERKLTRMKQIVGGLSFFLLVLGLANLGTSFAALFLTKELVVDDTNGVMLLQSTGALAAVQSAVETVELIPLTEVEYEERKLKTLQEIEQNPNTNAHRRLEVKDFECIDGRCEGSIMFDHGKIKEKDFRNIEQKCKQQSRVKIRRSNEIETRADTICSSGTTIIIKPDKGENFGEIKGRDVMIVSPSGKKLNADCEGKYW